jgi:hypothetical protein
MTEPNRLIGLFPASDGRGHGHQDLLGQILSIRILQSSVTSQTVNHRLIDERKLIPCLAIRWRFYLQQQAFPGFRKLSHPDPPTRQNTDGVDTGSFLVSGRTKNTC